MTKKLSTAEKVRRMIDQGHNNKTIIDKLGIKPQIVYNMRYQINKARGLGAIGKASPAPTTGIGAPPKKRTRKVKAGTGIAATPINPPAMDVPILKPIKPYEPMQPGEFKELPITMIEPKPKWKTLFASTGDTSLVGRIKRFFKGN